MYVKAKIKMESTEYRDAYCWFYGIDQKPFDEFDEIVAQKVQGTYQEEDQSKKYVPHFQFEIDAEKSKVRPIPLPVAALNSLPLKKQTKKKQNGQNQASQNKIANKINTMERKDFCFVNYGMGNVNQPNPKYNRTTFNVKAGKGVHPNTQKRAKLRGYIASQYARPPPQANVKVHEIKFIPDPSAAKKNQDVKGPYWVYWPSDEPFPEEYAELEKIVRPSSQ